jgi:2-polyprenyl-3-methyl-5-hydroxy-6-metoxy-1,4-benzoquinol methylase
MADNDIAEEKRQLQEFEYNQPVHWKLGLVDDLKYRRLSAYLAHLMNRMQPVRNARKVLFVDVGCGDGASTFQIWSTLKQAGLEVRTRGLDYSEQAVHWANVMTQDQRDETLEFVTARSDSSGMPDAEGWPVVLLMREVVEHLLEEEIDATLQKFIQIYGSGHVVITTPSTNSPTDEKHFRHYTAESLSAALTRNGMVPVMLGGFGFRPRFLYGPLVKLKSALSRRKFWWRLTAPLWVPCSAAVAMTMVAVASFGEKKP